MEAGAPRAVVDGPKLGSTQYRVPMTRLLQVVMLGFARKNCETVIPAASEMDTQVSPIRAVTTIVHVSAARDGEAKIAKQRKGEKALKERRGRIVMWLAGGDAPNTHP